MQHASSSAALALSTQWRDTTLKDHRLAVAPSAGGLALSAWRMFQLSALGRVAGGGGDSVLRVLGTRARPWTAATFELLAMLALACSVFVWHTEDLRSRASVVCLFDASCLRFLTFTLVRVLACARGLAAIRLASSTWSSAVNDRMGSLLDAIFVGKSRSASGSSSSTTPKWHALRSRVVLSNVGLWNTKDRNIKYTVHGGKRISTACFTPDGRFLETDRGLLPVISARPVTMLPKPHHDIQTARLGFLEQSAVSAHSA